MDKWVNEYVLTHPDGRFFSGFTSNGRRKHTDNFKKALVSTYDDLIDFCYSAVIDYKTTYSIHHVDIVKGQLGEGY